MYYGNNKIKDVYYGDTKIRKAYYGSTLVYNAQSTTGTHAGHDWVDLGLPSGLLWADSTVSGYYSWGETYTKDNYSIDNYSLYEANLGNISGDAQYDAVVVNWGSGWRMPTYEEYLELLEHTNCQTYTDSPNISLVSKYNNTALYMIPKGYVFNLNIEDTDVFYEWTSEQANSTQAIVFHYVSHSDGHIHQLDNQQMYRTMKYYGISIRPVLDRSSLT